MTTEYKIDRAILLTKVMKPEYLLNLWKVSNYCKKWGFKLSVIIALHSKT
jgi:hypothetical protein